MKGVILAGGTGSRLHPLTRVTNKHLLPVFDRPMVFYPLQTLVSAGIEDILLVTGGHNAGDFLRLLGNGRDFGLKHINYTYQEGEGGIADALRLAEHFADRQPICVALGDNIIETNIIAARKKFDQSGEGAHVILKEVPDPERFGVPVFEGDKIIRIEEKPKQPQSRYAVTGFYMYDARVFDRIRGLKPSARGELEITDVNNLYLSDGRLSYSILEGWWTDAGTFDSLLRANNLVAQTGANKVGSSGSRDDRSQPSGPGQVAGKGSASERVGEGKMLEVCPTEIPDVKIIQPRRHSDQRGFFSETYNKRALLEVGIELDFVQDNHSLSAQQVVVRGLHYQVPPLAQDKLIRVVRGSVFDVAVDLRRRSPTYGKHVSVILSAKTWNQVLVPRGFAHGFSTLEPNTEVIYKVSNYYSAEAERGVFWNSPELRIPWPVAGEEAILSDKDSRLPTFGRVRDFFD